MQDEILSDFSAPQFQSLLLSPLHTPLTYSDRCTPSPPGSARIVTNTLFSRAWRTLTTVRAQAGVVSKSITATNITPEYIILYSLGTDLCGYRNIAHGGVLLALVDQTIGECAVRVWGLSAMTVEFNSVFKRPLGLPGVAVCKAVGVRREGRRVWLRGTAEDAEGRVCAEATAMFVIRGPGRL